MGLGLGRQSRGILKSRNIKQLWTSYARTFSINSIPSGRMQNTTQQNCATSQADLQASLDQLRQELQTQSDAQSTQQTENQQALTTSQETLQAELDQVRQALQSQLNEQDAKLNDMLSELVTADDLASVRRVGLIDPLAADRASNQWRTVTFDPAFPEGSTVVVIPMTQEYLGPETPGLRVRNVNTTSFQIRFDELVGGGTSSDGNHANEQVGWVAFALS